MLNRHTKTMVLTGAIEEIILQHRALIDEAVRSLQERTSTDGFVDALLARITDLQLQEPSCWELRVAGYIQDIATQEVISELRNCDSQTNQDDVERAKVKVQTALTNELERLLELINHRAQRPHVDSAEGEESNFLELFWRDVALNLETSLGDDANECEDRDAEMPTEHVSYEVITFEDLQDETTSADSSLCLEDVPVILDAFSSANDDTRHLALKRLSQVSPVELVHCSMFHRVVDQLCSLFLDEDVELVRSSVCTLYSVINHVEEPGQFLDLYLTIVDRIGTAMSTKTMTFCKVLEECSDENKAIDVVRLLHLAVCRVPYHWIHFSQEKLAFVICATIVVLMLEPSPDEQTWRIFDIFAGIDPEAKWFSKWTARVPSRPQLLTSLEETGFLGQLMYAMTRVRPLDAGIAMYERARIANVITILGVMAKFKHGRDEMFKWTKLPAHTHHQHRYTEWRGLDHQFRMSGIQRDNEKIFYFRRIGRTVATDHRSELEEGGPLGEQALVDLMLSSIVLYVFDDAGRDRLCHCVQSASKSITHLSTREHFMACLFEFIVQGRSGISLVSAGGESELEERDPWFPFRRPKEVADVVKIVTDAAHRRGLQDSAQFAKRCHRILGILLEESMHVPPQKPTLALEVSNGFCVYLEETARSRSSDVEIENLAASVMTSLQGSLDRSPYTFALALSRQSHRICSQLSQELECTKSPEYQRALFGLLLTMSKCSALTPMLLESGLWHACHKHLVLLFDASNNIDLRILQLLCISDIAESYLSSKLVQTTLQAAVETCRSNLDVALAINSPLVDCPFHLQELFRNIAALRATLTTHGISSLYSSSTSTFMEFVAESVLRHKNGGCKANPQSEDLCTLMFDCISAAAGSIPAMVGVYDLLANQNAHVSSQDNTVSACSYLADSLYSSLLHVGGHTGDWIRPRQLCTYPKHSSEPAERAAGRKATGLSMTFEFSSATTCAIGQMLTSIGESRARGEALDMVMLSQATWDVIADIEKLTYRKPSSLRVMTEAFGTLIFCLVRSGQSKLGEGKPSHTPATMASSFPTDAERKLMNTYYKDYSLQLGLEASPTTLHMLTKVFGGAATDCFSVTLLMILGQTHTEQEIIDILKYCAGCPTIYVLWPRINRENSSLPTLWPLAQAAEMILESEFPQIFPTLRACHCSVLALVLRWHSQCYWNYLTWDNIVLTVYLNFLYGAEFQVYVFVAIVKYFEPTMRMIISRNRGDSATAFAETLQTPIEGFRFHTARSFILTLRSTYHDRVQNMLRR